MNRYLRYSSYLKSQETSHVGLYSSFLGNEVTKVPLASKTAGNKYLPCIRGLKIGAQNGLKMVVGWLLLDITAGRGLTDTPGQSALKRGLKIVGNTSINVGKNGEITHNSGMVTKNYGGAAWLHR